MKKLAAIVMSLAVMGSVFFISGCTEDDTAGPVITITDDNDANNRVAQYSATTFDDPGATATDAEDGVVTVTADDNVNMTSAGEWTVIYSATDKAGNTNTKTRTVTVDGGLFLQGSYTAEDFVGSTSYGTYSETITPSSTIWNKINFTKFGKYTNAAVYGTISGGTITIPSQTLLCGLPPDDKNHTFSGSGTYTNVSPFTFTINFHDSSSDGEYDCHDVYVRI